MSWITILQSAIASLLSFLIWTAVFYGFFLLRNKRLEFKLKRLIRPERTDPDEDRVHMVCANSTDVRIIVRDIRLISEDNVHISLSYIGDTGDVIHPRRDKDLAGRGRRELLAGQERAGLIERGFVELPAQTAGLWALKTDQVRDGDWQFTRCLLVVDYPTLLGTRRLMKVRANKKLVTELNQHFREYVVARGESASDQGENAGDRVPAQ